MTVYAFHDPEQLLSQHSRGVLKIFINCFEAGTIKMLMRRLSSVEFNDRYESFKVLGNEIDSKLKNIFGVGVEDLVIDAVRLSVLMHDSGKGMVYYQVRKKGFRYHEFISAILYNKLFRPLYNELEKADVKLTLKLDVLKNLGILAILLHHHAMHRFYKFGEVYDFICRSIKRGENVIDEDAVEIFRKLYLDYSVSRLFLDGFNEIQGSIDRNDLNKLEKIFQTIVRPDPRSTIYPKSLWKQHVLITGPLVISDIYEASKSRGSNYLTPLKREIMKMDLDSCMEI